MTNNFIGWKQLQKKNRITEYLKVAVILILFAGLIVWVGIGETIALNNNLY